MGHAERGEVVGLRRDVGEAEVGADLEAVGGDGRLGAGHAPSTGRGQRSTIVLRGWTSKVAPGSSALAAGTATRRRRGHGHRGAGRPGGPAGEGGGRVGRRAVDLDVHRSPYTASGTVKSSGPS